MYDKYNQAKQERNRLKKLLDATPEHMQRTSNYVQVRQMYEQQCQKIKSLFRTTNGLSS